MSCKSEHSKAKGMTYGYIAWHEWAAWMGKRFVNTKCSECGLWKVWRKK